MQPHLPLAKYIFTFQAIDPVSLPAFADPLWRSVFGLALRRLSCIADQQQCDSCLLRHQCDYAFLTTGPNPPPEKTGITRNMKNIPNPHVFQGRVRDYAVKVPAGAAFSTRLNLIGSGNDRLPAVIQAMAGAGDLGLGRRRARFKLLEVLQTGPVPPDRLIMNNRELLATGIPAAPPVPAVPDHIRFTFLTPYLLPANTDLGNGFNDSRLIMQIIRRISSLQEPYTGDPARADFKHLKSLAASPAIIDADLYVEQNYSYFGNKKRFTAVRGAFIMQLANRRDLWPWLYLGQWLNVGKQASKGFGRYWITVVSDHNKIA